MLLTLSKELLKISVKFKESGQLLFGDKIPHACTEKHLLITEIE